MLNKENENLEVFLSRGGRYELIGIEEVTPVHFSRKRFILAGSHQ
jgi:hypothetical protein